MSWLQSSPTARQRHRAERARMHAEVQAGRWVGASPVRRLEGEELRRYEAELLARDGRRPASGRIQPLADPCRLPARSRATGARKGRPLSTDGTTRRERVQALLRQHGPMRVTQIAELMKPMGKKEAISLIAHLARKGHLRRIERGLYGLP